jgi:hypothetical protein
METAVSLIKIRTANADYARNVHPSETVEIRLTEAMRKTNVPKIRANTDTAMVRVSAK